MSIGTAPWGHDHPCPIVAPDGTQWCDHCLWRDGQEVMLMPCTEEICGSHGKVDDDER